MEEAEGGVVQEPLVRTSEFKTTVSTPAQATILLGGLEDPNGSLLEGPRAGDADLEVAATRPATRPAGAKKPRPLLLLVKPTLVIQREVEMKPFPMIKSRDEGR